MATNSAQNVQALARQLNRRQAVQRRATMHFRLNYVKFVFDFAYLAPTNRSVAASVLPGSGTGELLDEQSGLEISSSSGLGALLGFVQFFSNLSFSNKDI